MSDADIRAARDRIETVEKRIASLAEAGVDVASLRAQLAFAHGAMREARLADAEAIADEVLDSARRLAELGGRSSPHPAQTRTPASGTEAIQRVKIQRAQLADEVRAAIDAEVQNQISSTSNASPLPGLAREIDRLSKQVAGLAAAGADSRMLAERLQSLEVRLASAETRPAPAADPALLHQIAALEARLAAAESRPAPAADPSSLRQVAALEARLAGLEATPREPAFDPDLEDRLTRLEARPPVTSAEVAALVSKALEEAVPRQTTALMQEAMSRLPTRDDLAQIADTLRADLDWRLERAAAEHGWCSLADVQSTVRKSIAEQDPGGAPPSQLARLEGALAEFVQHSRDQQDRLINALAERVAQHTKSLTRRMLVRPEEGDRPHKRHETEELSPSSSEAGHGSSGMMAITNAMEKQVLPQGDAEVLLDAVPSDLLSRTRDVHGQTTRLTMKVAAQAEPQVELPDDRITDPAAPAADEPERDLHDLVTAEVERALSGAVASTLSAPVPVTDTPPPKADDVATLAASPAQPGSATGLRALTNTASDPGRGMPPADVAALVAAEVARQLAGQRPAAGGDIAAALVRALPAALQDPEVRTELFAVLALEAAAKPGALGELTGLRRFLKRELEAAAEAVARREAVPA